MDSGQVPASAVPAVPGSAEGPHDAGLASIIVKRITHVQWIVPLVRIDKIDPKLRSQSATPYNRRVT